MATPEEPAHKKSRKIRQLELDLSQFPEWVGKADDNTLLQIFAIGVKVKDSIAINITENPELIKDAVDELKPVCDKIEQISKDFFSAQTEFKTNVTSIQSDATNLKNELVIQVQSVVNKVPALHSISSDVSKSIEPVKTSVDKLAERLNKPSYQGALAEQDVYLALKDKFPTHTINHVGRQGRKGDIEITSPSDQHYLVEVKDWRSPITKEIDKFKKNVSQNKVKVGILFSLNSGILTKDSRFTIKYEDNQYYIYVPNVLNDQQHLVVWAVILADQLACLNQGITEPKTQMIAELLEEFKENMERSQSCKDHLRALKSSVEALERAITPILTIMKNARTKLNNVLNKSD